MRILLKTLTEKSIIEGGKKAGLSVGDLLNSNKLYLIYTYFNYSNLTFTEKILDELNIKKEDRIIKPGKKPELTDYYTQRNIHALARMKSVNSIIDVNNCNDIKVQMIKKNIIKGKFKSNYKALIERERRSFSKGSLQRKNQGH